MIAIAFISNGDGLSLSLLKSPSWENNRAIQNPAALHSSTLLSRVTDKDIPAGKLFSVWFSTCFQCGRFWDEAEPPHLPLSHHLLLAIRWGLWWWCSCNIIQTWRNHYAFLLQACLWSFLGSVLLFLLRSFLEEW